MNRVTKRTWIMGLFLAVLLGGMAFFLWEYATQAGEWVTFPGSPHVYNNANIGCGTVTDRSGNVLLDITEERTYSSDAATRQSTLHWLGDRKGFISASAVSHYAGKMAGFDLVNGIYDSSGEGGEMTLTLSARVQNAALEAMDGRKGTVGIYNYKTGEILCALTTPTYDPDNMPDVENDTTGAYDGVYLNRFFQTTYVPGSIFKLVTATAALETIPDILNQTFTCNGTWEVEGDVIHCNGVHGTITLAQALGHSCNVAFGQLAVQVGAETMTEYANRLGITESLEFDGITTAQGNYDVSDAVKSQLAWSGIGQYTNLINACQYMSFMGAIANGGSTAVPHLMQSVTGGLLTGYEAKTVMTDQLLSAQTAGTLADMMHQAVLNHYGAWQFPDLYVCAKSGTAEVGEGTTPHATFAGFIRDDNYPLAFIVIVEHGGSGSATCAPIAGQILNACVAAMDAEQ